MDFSASGLGVVASFAVMGIKKWFSTTTLQSYIAAAVVSLVLSVGYSMLSGQGWVISLANVFISSQATYALITSELQAK